MSEEDIRRDERQKAAQELLRAMGTAHKRLQAGLWFAATILDPNVMEDDN